MQRFNDAREAISEWEAQAKEPRRGANTFNLPRHSVSGICRYRSRKHRRASIPSRICDSVREADDDRAQGQHVSQPRFASNIVGAVLQSFLQATFATALTQAHRQLWFTHDDQLTLNRLEIIVMKPVWDSLRRTYFNFTTFSYLLLIECCFLIATVDDDEKVTGKYVKFKCIKSF